MKKWDNSLAVFAAAAALTLFAGTIVAQDEAPAADAAAEAPAAEPATDAAPVEGDAAAADASAEAPAAEASADAAATEAPATDTAATDGAPAEAAAPPVKPRDSEVFPLASKGLMLDVTNTGKHLIAVGDRGTVLASNNGKDWAQVVAPTRSALTAVSFADENTGWAVGHDAAIIKTTDGGKTWALQNFQPELEKAFLDVIALDGSSAIAVGSYGLLYQTADGGTTWTQPEAEAIRGEELHLNGITKLGNGSLLVVGEQGTLGISADNGATWEKVTSPYEGSLYGAVPNGDSGVLVYGLRGNVLTSADVKGSGMAAPAAEVGADPAATTGEAAPADAAATDAAAAAPTETAAAAAPTEADPAAATDGTASATVDISAAATGGGAPLATVSANTVASFFGAAPLPDGGTALVGLSGTVIVMDSSGGTRQLRVKVKELDGYGKEQEKDITGSFSSAVAFAGGLVVVGEQGVQSLKLN